MTTEYSRAFSTERIDSEPLPIVSKDLLPWLIKDRREAIEGVEAWVTQNDGKRVWAHDGAGLEKAEQSLRRATAMLIDADDKTRAFLESQRSAAEGKVSFYRGKVYLMDKVIAATQARQ